MNGLNQIRVSQIFDQKKDFNGIVFSDIETFVRLAAEYLKRPRNLFKARDKLLGIRKRKKVKVALCRTSDYAFENFSRLKYHSLAWEDGDIVALKMRNYKPCIRVAKGIEAVTELIEEEGF